MVPDAVKPKSRIICGHCPPEIASTANCSRTGRCPLVPDAVKPKSRIICGHCPPDMASTANRSRTGRCPLVLDAVKPKSRIICGHCPPEIASTANRSRTGRCPLVPDAVKPKSRIICGHCPPVRQHFSSGYATIHPGSRDADGWPPLWRHPRLRCRPSPESSPPAPQAARPETDQNGERTPLRPRRR